MKPNIKVQSWEEKHAKQKFLNKCKLACGSVSQ